MRRTVIASIVPRTNRVFGEADPGGRERIAKMACARLLGS
jgi:hypothetical protein